MKAAAAKCLSFGLIICAIIADLPQVDERVENLQKLIKYGIQENEIIRNLIQIRSSHAKDIIQTLDRQMVEVMRSDVPRKFEWFKEFTQENDLLRQYGHKALPHFSKITNLERIHEEFYDFRFHFNLTVTVKNDRNFSRGP